eukprot:gene29994-18067_t
MPHSFLSFDVGTRNLAFCRMSFSENSIASGKVTEWEVIDLGGSSVSNFPERCALVLTAEMEKRFGTKLREGGQGENIDYVLIERQPKRRSMIMMAVQMFLCQYFSEFVLRKQVGRVVFVSPVIKLKTDCLPVSMDSLPPLRELLERFATVPVVIDMSIDSDAPLEDDNRGNRGGPSGTVESSRGLRGRGSSLPEQRRKYALNKGDAVVRTCVLLHDVIKDHSIMSEFLEEKKKDDLADAFMQGKASYRNNGVHALLVGAYEGRVLQWLIENVLTGPKDTATVLDPFDYKPCVYERGQAVWNPPENVRNTLQKVVDKAGNSTVLPPETSLASLSNSSSSGGTYDIVYVDAKDSVHALESGVHAMRLLHPSGILVFQNYVHNQEHDTNCPRIGIDAFLSTYVRYIRVLRNTFHTFVQKRTTAEALPKRVCHAEMFPLPEEDEPKCRSEKVILREVILAGKKAYASICNAGSSTRRQSPSDIVASVIYLGSLYDKTGVPPMKWFCVTFNISELNLNQAVTKMRKHLSPALFEEEGSSHLKRIVIEEVKTMLHEVAQPLIDGIDTRRAHMIAKTICGVVLCVLDELDYHFCGRTSTIFVHTAVAHVMHEHLFEPGVCDDFMTKMSNSVKIAYKKDAVCYKVNYFAKLESAHMSHLLVNQCLEHMRRSGLQSITREVDTSLRVFDPETEDLPDNYDDDEAPCGFDSAKDRSGGARRSMTPQSISRHKFGKRFVRGNYMLQNRTYILKLVSNMTDEERDMLLDGPFTHIWNTFWHTESDDVIASCFVREFNKSSYLYGQLSKGYWLRTGEPPETKLRFFNLESAILDTHAAYIEPEWGFPKGRRNINESDIECAKREFMEETAMDTSDIIFLQNIKPVEETFFGMNRVNYRHIYYVASIPVHGGGCVYSDATTLSESSSSKICAPDSIKSSCKEDSFATRKWWYGCEHEIRRVEWFNENDVRRRIRQENTTRLRMFDMLHQRIARMVMSNIGFVRNV